MADAAQIWHRLVAVDGENKLSLGVFICELSLVEHDIDTL